jgi:hypothetical protein
VLAGAVLGLSSLAGCVGGQGSGGPSETATPSEDSARVFERVAVEGTTLVIDLAEDADIDTVNVISPSGELYRRLAVYQGVKRLSTEIDEAYTPGSYEIVGVNQSKKVKSFLLDITPHLVITNVSLETDGRVKFPDKMGRTSVSEVAVTVANTGSGPAFVRKLLVLGDVPNPTTELVPESIERSGIFDTESNRFYSDGVTIPPRSTAVIFSDSLAFSFVGDGWDCEPESKIGQVEIIVQTRQMGQSISTSRRITYESSDRYNTCGIRIGGGQ